MHGSSIVDPPAMVAEAPLDENQLVEAIASAAIRDNFAVGRYALQWHVLHSRQKSDAALAKLVNQTNTLDDEVSHDYIRRCRIVAKQVTQRCVTLSWYHHWVAVDMDKKNAQAWLEKAEKSAWSGRQLEAKIYDALTEGRKSRSPQQVQAMRSQYKAFLRSVEDLSERKYVEHMFNRYSAGLIGERKEVTKKLKAIKRNADFLIDRIAKSSPANKRKEA